MKYMNLLFLMVMSACSGLSATNMQSQTAWDVLNIKGYAIDPTTGQIDDTEGFGAFDSLMKLFRPVCPKNFDNGGGAFNDNSAYIKDTYNIENVVYDPFMRDEQHNEWALAQAQIKLFDCSTSISVLNVIDTEQARYVHIKICFDVLKEGGSAFFKVWPGNGSGIGCKSENSYQSNKDATHYVDEIKNVFGSENVMLVDNKTIKAIKKIV